MKKVQSTLFQSWGTKVSNKSTDSKTSICTSGEVDDEDDADLDDETLLAACQEWDNSGTTSNAIAHGTPLEDLPGFDNSSGHIWIYPTNLPVRDYQLNIVEQSLLKNTLVTLPTGLGKTFIAAVVMYNFYRWYPSGKIVFMAPTKPLVAQQIEACYNIMGIPQNHTAEMTGSMHPPERRRVWQSGRVFFLTPQVLMNDLSRKACPADDIKCLVVDEAHKALGNHSYCQVVRELSKYTVNFRVLALSATPGSDLKAVQQVLTNLMIAHIEIRSEEAIDIQKYVHSRKIDKYVVPLGKELEAIQGKYLQIVSLYVNKLNRTRCLYISNPKSLSKFQVLKCRDAFRQDPPQHMQRAQIGVAEGDFAILISLYHGYELLLQHGMHSLHCFLTSMVDGSKGISRARTELMRNQDFSDLMEELERKFKGEKEEAEVNNRSFSSTLVKVPKRPFVYSHPKLKKLEEVVIAHFEQYKSETGAKMNTRVMIFTQYRDSVHEISNMLNQHKPTINCMAFIGQSSAGKSSKGFTQKEQLRVVKEFRAGGYNTIVSTCVGEEGLDIGDVDLIVCYDAHKSPIRLVQRMGRTGRKREGRIVMLVTEGKEETVYNQSLSNKKGIHKALHSNNKKLQLYHNNPRMVPKGLNPTIHKMYLTVASAYKNKHDRKSASTSSIQSKINNVPRQGPKCKDDAFLSEEELQFWNLHYKLDAPPVKRIPAGGRFLTIGDKTSLKKQKTSSSEFSLSEWSIWQTKKQPFKFVDHSKRCKNFVDIQEFLEIQGVVEGEDVYGMEMATFLNKDDVIRKKSRTGIQKFCVNQQLDGKDATLGDKKSVEDEDSTENQLSKSESKNKVPCLAISEAKSKSLMHNDDTNHVKGAGTLKTTDDLEDNTENVNNNKKDIEHQQRSGGKRKRKTKHLTPVQYSDDDDFKFNDLLPTELPAGDSITGKANNKHKENKDLNEGMSEQDDLEVLPFYDPSHKEPLHDDQHDDDQHNDDQHNDVQEDDDQQDSDLSVVFPCTQVRTGRRSLPFSGTDKISPKRSLPPKAPNISSLDFLDDIDDLTFGRSLSSENLVDDGRIEMQDIEAFCPQVEEVFHVDMESEEHNGDGNEITKVDKNSKTEVDSNHKQFDLQFDLEDFFNDSDDDIDDHENDDDDDDDDDDDGIIPPSPARFNIQSERSQQSQLLRMKLPIKSVDPKPQKNLVEFEATNNFIPTKSSTPGQSSLNNSQSRISKSSVPSSCDIRSDLCKTSSVGALPSSTDSTNLTPKIPLAHGKMQSGFTSKRLSLFTESHGAPDTKKQEKCITIQQISMLPDEDSKLCEENHEGTDIATLGIKRKSDPLPPWRNDGQKKRKLLTEDLELTTNDEIVCRTLENKSSETQDPKARCIGKNVEEDDDDVADDSEDEIQTRRRNKKNVLSSPVFKTPIKPAMKSKRIMVSSDSDDKISSDELASPLGRRLLKKSSGASSALLNRFINDHEDFQDFVDVRKKLPTPLQRKSVETNAKITIKHRKNRKSPTHNLLDMEAEVESGADCSSDEDDASQVDQSILDFINDNTICSQGADLQTIYLQSLKDSDNLNVNSRYKLKPRSNIDDQDIFLQVPQQDENYGDDSFVIYEENEHACDTNSTDDTNMFEMTINPENIINTKTRRGKRQQNPRVEANIKETTTKKGKRKRVIMYDSSSEEECIQKINHVVNCTGEKNLGNQGNKNVWNTYEKCSSKWLPSDTDTELRTFDVSLKSFETTTSRTTINTPKKDHLSCEQTCTKTQEQIAREERLKRQKEKQLEFRRKMAERERKSEVTKTSGQISDTRFHQESKKTDRQTLSTCERLDLSIGNDLNPVGNDFNPVGNDSNPVGINSVERNRNEVRCRGTNHERLGLALSETKTPVTSHETRGSGNLLREEYGLSQKIQRCDGQPVVLVDSGVLSSCPHIASTLELQHNLNSNVCQLSACDFMVSNRMGVIRRSFSDFANGANRNKLVDQVRHICQLFDRPCLIVEADRLKKPEEKRIYNRTKYLDRTIAQLIKTHMKLIFTDTTDETASVLADLARMESRKGFSIQFPEMATQKQGQIFKICVSIPFLNFAGAMSLSKNYSTFADVISSTPSQLEVKARISASRAQELHQFFKHKFNSEMLGNP